MARIILHVASVDALHDALAKARQLRPELEVDPYYLNIDGADPYERLESVDDDRIDLFKRGGNIVYRDIIPVPGWRERDFTVDSKVAEKIGFEQIPFQQIGLYCDAYRRQLPPLKMPMG